MSKISKENFFRFTYANFQQLDREEYPTRSPDFISNSGSKYWYTKEGVIRYSTHWNRHVATCKWFLNNCNAYGGKYGYCKFKDFQEIKGSFDFEQYFEVGKKYEVLKASYDRKGNSCVEKMIGKYIKRTKKFIIFDKFRVSEDTYITAKLIK